MTVFDRFRLGLNEAVPKYQQLPLRRRVYFSFDSNQALVRSVKQSGSDKTSLTAIEYVDHIR